jgi:hypothetical protein
MTLRMYPKVLSVIGPLGERLTWDSLPSSQTKRWVIRRKAQVVAAVNGGLLSAAQACIRYDLTVAELAEWQRSFSEEGMGGLRLHRLQSRRRSKPTKVKA